MAGTVIVDRDDAVVTLRLSNPARLNAFDRSQWAALDAAIADAAADDSVRLVILRGDGGKAFSPGADISEFETERASPEQAQDYGNAMDATLDRIRTCPHPTLAAIEGACCGIGLAVALACDLRLCTESSRFGVPVSRLGIAMALPELKLVVDAVGPANALEILLEGRVFDAARAAAMGLVNRVAPDSAFADEVAATTRRILDGAPLAARWHKRFIHRLGEAAPLTAEEIAESYLCFGTDDYREGYRAFLDKRRPAFRGR